MIFLPCRIDETCDTSNESASVKMHNMIMYGVVLECAFFLVYTGIFFCNSESTRVHRRMEKRQRVSRHLNDVLIICFFEVSMTLFSLLGECVYTTYVCILLCVYIVL